MNPIETIQTQLFALRDETYRDFNRKLILNIDLQTIIGVRTPELRKLAKELMRENAHERTKEQGTSESNTVDKFLQTLPHTYFEENQLHAFLIEQIKDYGEALAATEAFLPYVDNWATCDQLSPKVFKKHPPELETRIKTWISSGKTYTIRFGIGMLLTHFLDGNFKPEYLEWVAVVRSEEYYVNMMIAWYFATALAKQYDAALPYIEQRRLSPWTHNKAIQKALESYRVSEEAKMNLKLSK
ncbi:MAG TPA: DNA alkylation repair protein [Oscillospiraceae bacterium]|nr:DNA alkylation repair protein [Oscillospiraceae bacterium]HPK34273.1 DNA alkylation repair protein [Oscillospiraceae bacterium]HPR74824.1 DNA alkylation repair protein [Oscillospiraceae bacterium]